MVKNLRICLPMQEKEFQFLVQEDSMCRRAARPLRHSYRAAALEPVLCNRSGHCIEKPEHHKWRVATACCN